MRLSYKLAVILGLIAVLATAVVGTITFRVVRGALRDEIGRSQVEIARGAMDKIDRLLYERYVDIQAIAAEETMEQFLLLLGDEETLGRPENEARFEDFYQRLQELPFLTGPWDILMVTDREGTVVASTLEDEVGGQVVTDPQKLAAHEQALSGQIYASDLVIFQDTGQPTIIFAAPIYDEEREGRPILGAIMANFSWPVVEEVLRGVEEDTHLYNAKGQIIGGHHNLTAEEIFAVNVESDLLAVEALAGGVSSDVLVNHHGVEALVSAVPQQGFLDYQGAGWVLSVDTPATAALASATNTAFQLTSLAVFFILLIAVVVLITLGRLVVAPVSSMTGTARAVAAGDLSRRVEVTSSDEMGELGTAFNEMTASLQESRQELEDSSAELNYSLKHMEEQNIDLENTKKATLNILADVDQTNRELQDEATKRQEAEQQLFDTNKSLQETAQKLTIAGSELAKAFAEKGEFMNVAAHELRTPLQPIIGYVDRLLRRGDLNDWQTSRLQIVLESARRLLRLVQDVLDANKLETGVMKFYFKTIDIKELLQEMHALFKPSVEKRGLTFKLKLPKALSPIRGDAQRLTQVFGNLITNAIKFTKDGSITVEAVEEAESVVIKVTDTGIGIDKKFLPKLFVKFFQIDDSSKRKAEGTGLGLAISKEIVKAHKGEILVDSEVGKGSTFRVTLPKAKKS